MQKIDWSSLWTKEDWWACWIGWFLLLLGVIGILPALPQFGTWVTFAQMFPKGFGPTMGTALIVLLLTGILSLIGAAFMKKDIRFYIPGFIVIFALSFIAILIGAQKQIKHYGFEFVLWALFIGLFISNVLRVPRWLKEAVMTEYYIKIGLVAMGATILFQVIVKAGALGMGQALIVVGFVWFTTYWICRRFGISERFSSVIATGNAICGVSAAIAAGGAVRGDPKEVSFIVAWLMICAVILIIIMPPIAKALRLPTNMAGAWVGGVIDNTGAVVAAGALFASKAALNAATLVKFAQNFLIGVAAFLMAVWATVVLERKPGAPRPSYMEIWYRFPKFILGFVVASFVMSVILYPALGAKQAEAIKGLLDGYRTWFFALCFTCIGLETRIKELVAVGGGRPVIAYFLAQGLNLIWTLIVAWFLWSGTFFTPPILPD